MGWALQQACCIPSKYCDFLWSINSLTCQTIWISNNMGQHTESTRTRTTPPTGKIHWFTIKNNQDMTRYEWATQTLRELYFSNQASYTSFNTAIQTTGKATATKLKKQINGWFEYNRIHMRPLVNTKANLLHELRSTSCPHTLEKLKLDLKEAKKDPAWTSQEHQHRPPSKPGRQHMKSEMELNDITKGKYQWDSKTQMDYSHKPQQRTSPPLSNILYQSFQTSRPTLANAAKLFHQREVMNKLSHPPTWQELKWAITKIKNDKQPGANGVMPNAFKCLDDQTCPFSLTFSSYSGGNRF